MRAYILLLIVFVTPIFLTADDQTPFYLTDGDTVVFYGDSITDQRLYTMATELYAVTRYPNINVRFVHSGWGGDRVSGGGGGPVDLRLKRDVFAYKPTVVTVMLGMNDGQYKSHTAASDQAFFAGYQHLIDSLGTNLPGLRMTLIGPSPFDDATRMPEMLPPSGYNSVLITYSKWIEHYAGEKKLDYADLNTGVMNMLRTAGSFDPATAQKIVPDRVHPSLSGHLIMAEQLLKSWHARAQVAAVEIDSTSGAAKADHAQVSDVKTGPKLTWTELDEALPLPVPQWLAKDNDHTIELALHSSDFVKALDQQPLVVTGLHPGVFKLSIDGQALGTYSAEQLANGINLAELDTPMTRQARDVYDLKVRHLDIHQFRWRTVQVPMDGSSGHMAQSLRELDALEADVVAQQRSGAKPRKHTYELGPAT